MRPHFASVLTTVVVLSAALAATEARAEPLSIDMASPPTSEFPPLAANSDDSREDVAGEIAVDLGDDATDADIRELEAHYGLALRPNSAWGSSHDKIDVADVDPAREDALVVELGRDRRVTHAEPMSIYRATFIPDDPLYPAKQWHLKRVGAERAWDYTCGRGVTVAVIDTGIACFDKGPFSRGTDLAGTRCRGGFNFVDDSSEGADDQGHGTHVAGTIAQTTNNGVGAAGLAHCATLMPVKVLNKQGFGTVANVAEGIRFAATEGADVINLSLGGPLKSRILEDAVEDALARGVVVVAAAGNTGRGVGYPAAYAGVLAVSATDTADDIASFSSRGPEVALAAPGVAVTQQTVCNSGRDKCEIFGTYSGTSMAAPHVAGVAAMLESLGAIRGSAVRDALLASARSRGNPELYGAGILDAGAATSRVFWGHFGFRLVALAGLAWALGRRIRRRGGRLTRRPSAWLGAMAAAIGVFPFLPLVSVGGPSGRFGMIAELAMRPFGEWDLVLLGVGAHRWMLLASALPAMALSAGAFANSRTRPFIGGFALGTAALMAQIMASNDEVSRGGALWAWVWVVMNGLVCLWIARIGLENRG